MCVYFVPACVCVQDFRLKLPEENSGGFRLNMHYLVVYLVRGEQITTKRQKRCCFHYHHHQQAAGEKEEEKRGEKNEEKAVWNITYHRTEEQDTLPCGSQPHSNVKYTVNAYIVTSYLFA